MGVKLSELTAAKRTIPVGFGEHTLTVTYKLAERTGERNDEMQLTDDIRDTIAALVAEWDLVGTNGKPVPLTRKGLDKVPVPLLRRIFVAIAGDNGIAFPTNGTASDGSRQR